ncbi:MAG: hypothetical protein WC635_12600 [Bacteriovorax sp.]|jgi:hypothetical protein
MKTLLIAIAILTTAQANARSLLYFKTITRCETVQKVKGSELIVEVQKAQDGQVQLVLSPSGQQPEKIQAKEILPPKGSAGGSTRYVGKDTGTDNNITLAITAGTAPIKVGKVIGRRSSLTVQNVFENLAMVCASTNK